MRVIKLHFVHPFILSGSRNKCWLHTCDSCVITAWRLGLRAPLVARNYFGVLFLQIKVHGGVLLVKLCTTGRQVLDPVWRSIP